MRWCEQCGHYSTDNHDCGPAWDVWRDDPGWTRDDAKRIYAGSPGAAVEGWAAEYNIARGEPMQVRVAKKDEPREWVYVVRQKGIWRRLERSPKMVVTGADSFRTRHQTPRER